MSARIHSTGFWPVASFSALATPPPMCLPRRFLGVYHLQLSSFHPLFVQLTCLSFLCSSCCRLTRVARPFGRRQNIFQLHVVVGWVCSTCISSRVTQVNRSSTERTPHREALEVHMLASASSFSLMSLFRSPIAECLRACSTFAARPRSSSLTLAVVVLPFRPPPPTNLRASRLGGQGNARAGGATCRTTLSNWLLTAHCLTGSATLMSLLHYCIRFSVLWI